MLKEQVQALLQENGILKRAVSIQHERQKEFEVKSQEVQQLKQLLSQCQEHIRTLEVRVQTQNLGIWGTMLDLWPVGSKVPPSLNDRPHFK